MNKKKYIIPKTRKIMLKPSTCLTGSENPVTPTTIGNETVEKGTQEYAPTTNGQGGLSNGWNVEEE